MIGRSKPKEKPSKEALISFGRKLTTFRESLNLKVEDLAYEFDVAPQTWKRFETGESIIFPAIIKALKKNYGIDCEIYPKKADDLVSIGERFIRIRDAVHKSYDEMANSLSIPPEVIRGIERDKRMQIPIIVLMNLIKVYNVNLNWLFTGIGNMFNQRI